jgi:ABC-type phosphate transport system permease subunit
MEGSASPIRMRIPKIGGERAELLLGALSVLLLGVIGALIAFVFINAWPSFSHNGLAWFGSGGNANVQLRNIYLSPANPAKFDYHIRAWPLIYGTILSTGLAVILGLVLALLGAVFLVEFAPPLLKRVLRPAVRLLAGVPSVIYGLVGLLALAPLILKHIVDQNFKLAVAPVVQISGTGLLLAVLILTIMITPIMLAIIADALESVPRTWIEGSAALGINRWRTMWRISVHTIRPAIAAGIVLATARALGEAIMLVMVSGAYAFSPNPLDGANFFLEPILTLASAIVQNSDGLFSVKPFPQTIYAFAAVLLVSAALCSLAGYVAKRPLRRYGIR